MFCLLYNPVNYNMLADYKPEIEFGEFSSLAVLCLYPTLLQVKWSG